MNNVGSGSINHQIPPEFISESVLLKTIEHELLMRTGRVDKADVIVALKERLQVENNIILNDIYRQTLEFVICSDR